VLGGGGHQLMVQFIGSAFIVFWSILISLSVFIALKTAGILRVSQEVEVGSKREDGAWARIQVMENGQLQEFNFHLK